MKNSRKLSLLLLFTFWISFYLVAFREKTSTNNGGICLITSHKIVLYYWIVFTIVYSIRTKRGRWQRGKEVWESNEKRSASIVKRQPSHFQNTFFSLSRVSIIFIQLSVTSVSERSHRDKERAKARWECVCDRVLFLL